MRRLGGIGGCGAAYVDTDASRDWYYTGGSKGNKDIGTATVVVSLGKTF